MWCFLGDGAKEIIKATGNKIPVGYITHLPEQDEIYKVLSRETSYNCRKICEFLDL